MITNKDDYHFVYIDEVTQFEDGFYFYVCNSGRKFCISKIKLEKGLYYSLHFAQNPPKGYPGSYFLIDAMRDGLLDMSDEFVYYRESDGQVVRYSDAMVFCECEYCR